jgi:hypothetical protein
VRGSGNGYDGEGVAVGVGIVSENAGCRDGECGARQKRVGIVYSFWGCCGGLEDLQSGQRGPFRVVGGSYT